jgi:hypothetical protein
VSFILARDPQVVNGESPATRFSDANDEVAAPVVP